MCVEFHPLFYRLPCGVVLFALVCCFCCLMWLSSVRLAFASVIYASCFVRVLRRIAFFFFVILLLCVEFLPVLSSTILLFCLFCCCFFLFGQDVVRSAFLFLLVMPFVWFGVFRGMVIVFLFFH